MKQHITDTRWQIDRRIPLLFLLTLITQIGAALIWATQLDARVEQVEKNSYDARLLGEKIGRMEERLEYAHEDMRAIKQQLIMINERLAKK
jgi:hypothetical protein